MTALGDFFPRRTNDHVPLMNYAADVRNNGYARINIPMMVAEQLDGILDGVSINAAIVALKTFDADYSHSVMGKWGRNIVVDCSGAATSTVTIRGRDYLGQYMLETITLNGTTAVLGKKAFAQVDQIDAGDTSSETIDVGWGDVIGLPYKIWKMDAEVVADIAATSAGAVVVGVPTTTAQTATTGDPRGTYAPHADHDPNGVLDWQLYVLCDQDNLHGNVHYFA